jgi:hypothetical protein
MNKRIRILGLFFFLALPANAQLLSRGYPTKDGFPYTANQLEQYDGSYKLVGFSEVLSIADYASYFANPLSYIGISPKSVSISNYEESDAFGEMIWEEKRDGYKVDYRDGHLFAFGGQIVSGTTKDVGSWSPVIMVCDARGQSSKTRGESTVRYKRKEGRIESASFYFKSALRGATTYSYLPTEPGLIRKIGIYGADANEKASVTYEYDLSNRLVSATYIEKTVIGIEDFRLNLEFTYDSRGNIISLNRSYLPGVEKDCRKERSEISYEYTPDGKINKCVIKCKSFRKIQKKNERGQYVYIWVPDGEVLQTFTYKYDNRGNWTEMISELNGMKKAIRRAFVY